ncbi:MAG TPA: GNAT family N-acetyltransferase [Actinomycetota bacterium]|nr:GNAT family N-acetyltransferase [Actinomycetota bacterium]
MGEGVEVREASSLEDVQAVAALLERVWGKKDLLTADLLRALSAHGNPVLAAFRQGRMVGAQVGFVALEGWRIDLHSYVTGVLPGLEHRGVGFRLKVAQREWCLARGIGTVTWTFDPLLARNAHFNLRKLGATATGFLRNFYGPMTDALNAGDRSDRLRLDWHLRSSRVEAAVAGRPEPVDPSGALVVLDEEGGLPRPAPAAGERLLIRVPPDYAALRRDDPRAASAWRDAVAEAFEAAFAAGHRAVDFTREGGYVLERR